MFEATFDWSCVNGGGIVLDSRTDPEGTKITEYVISRENGEDFTDDDVAIISIIADLITQSKEISEIQRNRKHV